MKKSIKSIVSILAAIAVLVMVPAGNVLPVKAAEPVTYSIKYIGGSVNDWRFQPGSTFDDGGYHWSIYLLNQDLKDGDAVVIYPGEVTPNKELNLGTVKLGNLTIYQNAHAVVLTGGIKDCYVLAGSTSAINGNVTNAYLYDGTTCTFNNDVLDMTLYFNGAAPTSNLSCAGTVGHFKGVSNDNGRIHYEFYSISKGAFLIENGISLIPYEKCSPLPTEEYLQAAEAASVPATAAENNTSKDTSEYDKVPKTGDSSVYLWLFCASAFCFAGSRMLRKKTR